MQKETEQVNTTDYLEKESIIELRKQAAKFLYMAYGGILVFTISVVYLQGFKLCGFNISSEFLHWLGAATVGEVAGLAFLVYSFLFGKKAPESK